MSGAGGKWMASSVTKEDIKELREAGYLANGIVYRLPANLSLPQSPMIGWCFSHISSAGWDSLSTCLFAD